MNMTELIALVPEGFIPNSDEQDMEVMGPLFLAYESESNAFTQYNEEQCNSAANILNFNTTAFYIYSNSEPWIKQGPEHQTLARWRYQNDTRYKSFLFWLQSHKKHLAELELLKQHYADVQAKVDALDRVFATELYKHHSGEIYQLLAVANTTATKPDYPTSAVYMNIHTREVFVRPFDDFEAKNERFKELHNA